MSALEAVRARRSHSRVTDQAPTREQLLPLIEAAGSVADHGSLRPWRIIELRGEARERLGQAFVQASELFDEDAARLAAKPLRAPLLLAVVVSRHPSFKVHDWEQDAAAAGVAHTLSLLLGEAGWGVMWRTGNFTRTDPVRRMHELVDGEELLGWLYVGGLPEGARQGQKTRVDAAEHLSAL